MDLWASAKTNWIDRVTTWNTKGIRWREMSAVEILWMIHKDNLTGMSQQQPALVRQYLNATKDYDSLAWWDTRSMNEGDQSVGGV